MRRSKVLGVIAGLGLLLLAQNAGATTINFASLAQPGVLSTNWGTAVTVDGFVFTSTGSTYGFVTWNLDHPSHPNDNTAATTSLLEYAAGDTTTITKQGGGTFDLTQIDLAPWAVGQGTPGSNFTVLFTGVKPDNSTVTQLVTVQNLFSGTHPVLQTMVLSGFTGLTSVFMTQGVYAGGTAYQFNNLLVDVQSVPDPASTASLLCLGLGALAGIARRGLGRS